MSATPPQNPSNFSSNFLGEETSSTTNPAGMMMQSTSGINSTSVSVGMKPMTNVITGSASPLAGMATTENMYFSLQQGNAAASAAGTTQFMGAPQQSASRTVSPPTQMGFNNQQSAAYSYQQAMQPSLQMTQQAMQQQPSLQMTQQAMQQQPSQQMTQQAMKQIAAGGGAYSYSTSGPMVSQMTTTTTTSSQGGGGGMLMMQAAREAASQQANSSQVVSRRVTGDSSMIAAQEMMPSSMMTTTMGQGYVTGTRIVGHEYGAQRVISVNSHVDESRASIISERFVEHEVRIPKRIVREEIIERIIVVPEKVMHEEVIEEIQKVREKVVEVAKAIIQEKIVEIPEYEYVEKLIEVPERIVQEKIREVPRIEYQERIVEVPRIIQQEKIVEVPDIQYREVPYEKIIEVPQIQEQFVFREVPIPQYMDKPVPEYFDVEVPVDIERNIPVPVEAITQFEFRMPKLRPRYNRVNYQVYLPRFVEVPVAREVLAAEVIASAERYLQQLFVLHGTAASLCEIENLAAAIMKSDFKGIAECTNLSAAMVQAWQSGALQFQQMSRTTTSQMSSHHGYAGMEHAVYPMGTAQLMTTTTTTNQIKKQGSGSRHHSKGHHSRSHRK